MRLFLGLSSSILLFCILAVTTGCGSQAGPCMHEVHEPIVQIESVTDADSGEEIEEVYLRDIRIDENDLGTDVFYRENISEDDGNADRLICETSCGFGEREGTWTFEIGADDYDFQTETVDAEYEEAEGGCPSYVDGGTAVDVTLSN